MTTSSSGKPVGIGIIGCGRISTAYFNGASKFGIIKAVACADINMQAATEKAAEHGCIAQTVPELLANDAVDIVINLTIPAVHADISLQALRAGKHVYSEKPLTVQLSEADEVLAFAEERGLRVGCAPDTCLGAGLQTCRKLIDYDWLGRITSGTVHMLGSGPESWHPNPGFFYQLGG
ncbi:MAG: Gfo/Idh/MocA family protein, partial [Planctomycetota bacterium]